MKHYPNPITPVKSDPTLIPYRVVPAYVWGSITGALLTTGAILVLLWGKV